MQNPFNKRGRTGEDSYNPQISTGRVITNSNESIYYDTNLTVAISNDSGVTPEGVHGRFARFSDTRSRTLIPETGQYTLSLVRGSITTDSFPLFVPLLRPSTPGTPNPVLENGSYEWETTLQPGLALTWTGPVYAEALTGTGVLPSVDVSVASWPTYGFISVYSNTGVTTSINLGAISSRPDVLVATAASRLTTAFSAAGIPIAVSYSGQFYSFVNSSATITYYLDFSFPSSFAQSNQGGAVLPKAGLVQACKLLGFIPGQVFVVPTTSVITYAPRPFQMGFRTTLDLYSYKNVRWTPEDTSATPPGNGDDISRFEGTYFDCYTYEHLLNECINPTFKRLIYDEWDATITPGVTPTPLTEQCLQRQLTILTRANCNAVTFWSASTSYSVGSSVIFEGYAYYCQRAVVAGASVLEPTTNGVLNPDWVSCGPAIMSTWSPLQSYVVGDVVTYAFGFSRPALYICAVNSGPSATFSTFTFPVGSSVNMTTSASLAISPNIPAIGTIAPTIAFNPDTQLFTLNLDSYGFGGTSATNAYDGYYGYDDSPSPISISQQIANSSLNDQARDSWGVTGTNITSPAYSTFRHPGGIVYDERMVVESDDYFNQLFGNWPMLRLNYIDPKTSLVTSYVRYTLQASNAGLTIPTPLPLVNPTVSTTGYLPLTRIAGNQPFLYAFPQNYPSIGLMWNPIDTIVITTNGVPCVSNQTVPPKVLGDINQGQNISGNSRNIIAEFVVRDGNVHAGQEYRNQIVYEPNFETRIDLLRGPANFNTFDFEVFMRMKSTQLARRVTLSNGGSLNFRWHFQLKSMG